MLVEHCCLNLVGYKQVSMHARAHVKKENLLEGHNPKMLAPILHVVTI